MKYTAITKTNIVSISQKIEQFINRAQYVAHQSEYTWLPKFMNQLGIKNYAGHEFVEKTNMGYIDASVAKFEFLNDKNFIIRPTKDCIIEFEAGKIRIKITPTHIFIKGSRKSYVGSTHDVGYKSTFWKEANAEKVKSHIEFENEMSDQYWAEVDKEHQTEGL